MAVGFLDVATAELSPVPDAPALRLSSPESPNQPLLLFADLHLGLGANDRQALGPPEGSAPRMAEELLALTVDQRATGILIAGDIKHPIVGTPRLLRPVIFDFFSTLLRDGLEVEIVLGNHDVGLERHLPKEVVVHPAAGVVRYGVGIFHGHAWPSPAVLRAEKWVVGHLHPGFRFAATAESNSPKQRCWVHVRYPRSRARPRRSPRRSRPFNARELTVLPAFNPLSGTEALNRQRPSRGRSFLFQRFLEPGEARAYLLDGTDLGPIVTHWPRGQPTGSTPAAPSGR